MNNLDCKITAILIIELLDEGEKGIMNLVSKRYYNKKK